MKIDDHSFGDWPASPLYRLDENKQPVAARDMAEWAEWAATAWNDIGKRIVGSTELDGGAVWVSTVFLPAPGTRLTPDGQLKRDQFFETLVFGGPFDGGGRKYQTWQAAETGHAELVAALQALLAAKSPSQT